MSHYPNGQWVKHFFEPDGRYVSQFSDGRQLSARWSREGDKICLTGFRPRQILPRFCSRMVEADIGQSPEDVVDGLVGHRAHALPGFTQQGVGVGVRVLVHRGEHGLARRSHA